MEMDPNPPSFNIGMNVQPMDIGASYARGMTAGQAAGESLGKGISTAFDVMARNRTANDTLQAMNQSGILGDKAYQSVAGKSLGAKEQMLGMYASQWIAQQAQNRELQKLGYQGNVEVDIAHRKLLDTVSAVQSGYGAAAGVNLGKLPLGMGQGGAANQQAQLAGAMQAARGTAPRAAPVGAAPPIQRALPAGAVPPTQQAQQPSVGQIPYGGSASYVNRPAQLTIGAPLGGKDPVPAGAQIGTVRGQNGLMMPDGITFRPFQ